MTRNTPTPLLEDLRQSLLRQDGADLGDGELLESFITRRDEAAFEALVRRHGPMVLGVGLPLAAGAVAAALAQGKASAGVPAPLDRKSTRLNSSHANISYAVFC